MSETHFYESLICSSVNSTPALATQSASEFSRVLIFSFNLHVNAGSKH